MSTSRLDIQMMTNFLFELLHPVCVEYLFDNFRVEEYLGWEGLGIHIDIRKYRKWLSANFSPETAGQELPWMGIAR